MKFEWEGEGINACAISKDTGKKIVVSSEEFYRPAEVDLLLGDYSKAKKALGWEPKTKFSSLVELMVEYELNNN